jgi:hypothetical protein
MIEIRGQITYETGEQEEYAAYQRELADYERYALRHGYPLPDPMTGAGGLQSTTARYLAYAAVHRGHPRSEWPDFDLWADTVLEVSAELEGEPGENGAAVIPPTRPEVSAG